jgi:hypothetical protein
LLSRKYIMKKQYSIFVLLFVVLSLGIAKGQSNSSQPSADSPQQDAGQQPAAPAPALGQGNAPEQSIVNPPLSGLDQPALEPGLAARSFIIPGIHILDTADTDLAGNLTGSDTVRSVTRALGSVQVQRLWKNYDLEAEYAGGAAIYENYTRLAAQIHAFDIDQRIRWRTGQVSFRDSFTDMPEGAFGYSAFGGAGNYNLGGFGNVGGLQDAGGGTFFSASQYGSLGQSPRITNTALVEVTELLSPRASLTFTGSYGFTDFLDNPTTCPSTSAFCCLPAGSCAPPSSSLCTPTEVCCPQTAAVVAVDPTPGCLINSHQFAFQAGFNYQLNRRDQIALVYGYQDFIYPVSSLGTFNTNHIHILYGHRITGRMDLELGGGPQITEITPSTIAGVSTGNIRQITGTGRASLRYRFPRTTVSVSYDRLSTNGSGFFGGATTDIARISATHPINRLWTLNGDVGYTHNTRLIPSPTPGAPNSFQNEYFGFGLRRQFGRYLGGYLTYQYSDMNFDVPICSATDSSDCGRSAQRHTVIIGVDWHPRPIRLD